MMKAKSTAYIVMLSLVVICIGITFFSLFKILSQKSDANVKASEIGQHIVYDIQKDKIIDLSPPSIKRTESIKVDHPETASDSHNQAEKQAKSVVKEEASQEHTESSTKQGSSTAPEKDNSSNTNHSSAGGKQNNVEAETQDQNVNQEKDSTSKNKTFVNSDNLPEIAIIVTGLGLSKSTAEHVDSLPQEVAVSISPYSYFGAELADKLNKLGREVLVEVPMEPTDYPVTDPGPYALLAKSSLAENLSRIEWILGRVPNAFAALTPYEEKFSDNVSVFRQTIGKISSKGLAIVYGRFNNPARLDEIKRNANFDNFANVTAVLDGKESTLQGVTLEEKLIAAEKVAAEAGRIILLSKPYPQNMKKISTWARELGARRTAVLTPLSYVLKNEPPIIAKTASTTPTNAEPQNNQSSPPQENKNGAR